MDERVKEQHISIVKILTHLLFVLHKFIISNLYEQKIHPDRKNRYTKMPNRYMRLGTTTRFRIQMQTIIKI